ncbi:SUMF1/EgtB/PvdO family nonheme iron enzyme [Streptomyces virginiae]|uniref:SUMF1/EgtB/PvdO family nonheme iron enzyme n=1 Tax=Streptomyces virginiae TaxID=1961 RepID=UPI0036597170
MWLVAVRIERCVVANVEFRIFACATGYITDVERHGRPFVSAGLLPPGFPADRAVLEAPWWRRVGAHPAGLASDVRARVGHPVVQLSWNDAAAYVAWAGERLPTEAETGVLHPGRPRTVYFPCRDERELGGEQRMNVWQGSFPDRDTGGDGRYGTAPVTACSPNGRGLHDTCGNVWERCADRHSPAHYVRSPEEAPRGPSLGVQGVIRGGSYLCRSSCCRRHRVAVRGSGSHDSGAGHQGVRCALDDAPARSR